MREFTIYNSQGRKTKLKITNVNVRFTDSAAVDAEYQGLKVKDTLIGFGGGYKKPIIRFVDDNSKFVDVVLTDEIIEYLWKEIGEPTHGLLYEYTNNYRRNWCD